MLGKVRWWSFWRSEICDISLYWSRLTQMDDGWVQYCSLVSYCGSVSSHSAHMDVGGVTMQWVCNPAVLGSKKFHSDSVCSWCQARRCAPANHHSSCRQHMLPSNQRRSGQSLQGRTRPSWKERAGHSLFADMRERVGVLKTSSVGDEGILKKEGQQSQRGGWTFVPSS